MRGSTRYTIILSILTASIHGVFIFEMQKIDFTLLVIWLCPFGAWLLMYLIEEDHKRFQEKLMK